MSELIAISYNNKNKAEEVRVDLRKLQKEHLVDLEDAAVVIKDDEGKVKLNQAFNLTAAGAVNGGFWGALIGFLFLNPLLGTALGAGAGAVAGRFSDIGVNDDFMKELGEKLTPNSSALFILLKNASPDKVIKELEPFGGHVLRTSLSDADEQKLINALEKEEVLQ